MRDEIATIERDDPDYKYKAYKVRQGAILQLRKSRDLVDGHSVKELRQRHKDRLRTCMKLAVERGAVPKQVNPGPEQPPKTRPAKAQAKSNAHPPGRGRA